MDLLKQHGADINSLEASTHIDQSSHYQWIRRLCLWDSHARDNESYVALSYVAYDDQYMFRIPEPLGMLSSPLLSSLGPPLPASQLAALPPPPTVALPLLPAASRAGRFRIIRRGGRDFRFAPLALAARIGLTTAAKWLLENGADPEVTARDLCRCRNDPMMSDDMWRVPHQVRGPVMAQPHWTALHLAIHYGHDDIVQLLLDYGANTRQVCRSADGPCSALHTAFIHRRESIVDSLMIRFQGTDMVDINAPGRSGTPLHIAYCLNSPSLIDLALAYGAYVNIEYEIDQNQWTLFSIACAEKDWAFALRLLKLGANADFDLERKSGGRWTTGDVRIDIELQLAIELDFDALALKLELHSVMRDRELAYL